MIERIAQKMIAFYSGSLHDIEHFLKVHAYAAMIGRLEGLDSNLQQTLEIAAVVHDIACPLCRAKYGHADGKKQEEESEALLRPFLAEFCLPQEMLERVVYLVTHHHTTQSVCGADYQILLEADFLVNASEMNLGRDAVRSFMKNTAATASGRRLLAGVFSLEKETC